MDGDDRAAFDRHVVACAPCRAELADLRDVRVELSRWTPPEPSSYLPIGVADRGPVVATVVPRTRAIPVWAQAMAATLLVGVALGIANLDVSYSAAAGLSIRTGWRHQETVADTRGTANATPVAQLTGAAPWSSDLAALELELRSTLASRPIAATTAGSGNDEAVLRRVRAIVQDSERRQQSELALRIAEAMREVQTQRQTDLVKIDRTLGLMQSRTGLEVMRTQRQMNSLAQQVSQRP
jgi:hypothetical protein